MNYRPLGKSGIKVSEIGFGAWGIGSDKKGAVAYGPTDDNDSIAALKCAYENGINFYDTSDFYGYGHSEKLIGDAFINCRHDIVIASKVGMIDANDTQDFSTTHIRQSIEGSLSRLQTDYIDIYQLHSPSINAIEKNDSIISVLQRLKEEGKIREFGISLRVPEDGLVLVAQYDFSVIQINFNMIDQRAIESGLFELCEKKGVGVIGRTPLCFGFLTGHYNAKESFGSGDHRRKWSLEQRERWANAYQLFASEILMEQQLTHAQIALRFCLSYPSISTVIPGMLRTGEVLENSAASTFGPFSTEERTAIEKVYRANSFYI
jgi:aryl-alcohol dehydrogenase-like predicted oxidoreductase